MEKVYLVKECAIQVVLAEHLVRIVNDAALLRLLSIDLEGGTEQLVAYIRKDYATVFNKELQISGPSLAVEIWGHVYAEQISHAIRRLFKWKLTDRLDDMVGKRCRVIDAGETVIDNNRKIWDWVSRYKKWIARIIRNKFRPVS